MVQKFATLTRWEIMEDSLDSEFLILMHPNAENPDEPKQFFIKKSLLQSHLKKNPVAFRIILDVRSNERANKKRSLFQNSSVTLYAECSKPYYSTAKVHFIFYIKTIYIGIRYIF